MSVRVFPDGWIEQDGVRVRCALGRGGVAAQKREGDGVTPVGRFKLRRLHIRADRLALPETALPVRVIEADDGWCDDPVHPNYNRLIKRPFNAGHEEMWRGDALYDLVIEIGYNDDPPAPGAGSAIFVHVAKPGYVPTEGCVALAKQDLIAFLKSWDAETEIEILAPA